MYDLGDPLNHRAVTEDNVYEDEVTDVHLEYRKIFPVSEGNFVSHIRIFICHCTYLYLFIYLYLSIYLFM